MPTVHYGDGPAHIVPCFLFLCCYSLTPGIFVAAALPTLQVGLLHTDVRAENISCSAHKNYYFLLDLELVCRQDEVPFNLRHWTQDVLVDGRYTPASDISSLGCVVTKWAACAESTEGKDVLLLLQTRAAMQQRSAVEVLALAAPWFTAQGVTLSG